MATTNQTDGATVAERCMADGHSARYLGLTMADHVSGGYTTAALALDGAMARSESARAAYLAMWGVEWSPLYLTVPEAAPVAIVVTQTHVGTNVL